MIPTAAAITPIIKLVGMPVVDADGAGDPTNVVAPGATQLYCPDTVDNVYPLGHVGVLPSSHPKLVT